MEQKCNRGKNSEDWKCVHIIQDTMNDYMMTLRIMQLLASKPVSTCRCNI